MSYTSILVHYVFATHERRPLVSDEVQPKLWAYMGGITRTWPLEECATMPILCSRCRLLSALLKQCNSSRQAPPYGRTVRKEENGSNGRKNTGRLPSE